MDQYSQAAPRRMTSKRFSSQNQMPAAVGRSAQSVDKQTPTSSVSSRNTVSTADYSNGRSTGASTPASYSKKLVVVGDGGSGKTCLLIVYAQKYFPEKYVPTVFENYITRATHKASGKQVEFALWDTAGQEEYDRLRPLSYPETDVLLVCFAIDCPTSLENVMDKWFPEVMHFCPTTPLILVGLKSDLRNNHNALELLNTQGLRPISYKEGAETARKMNARYVECSSKTMTGVHEVMDLAIDVAISAEEEARRPAAGGIVGGPGGKNKRTKNKNARCRIL